MNRILMIVVIVLVSMDIMCAQDIGAIKGRVVFSEDESPSVGTAVVIREDSVTAMMVRTDNRGEFKYYFHEGVDEFRVEVNLPGYNPWTLSIANPTGTVDIGTISLTPEALTLDGVEVTATSGVIHLPDKNIVFPTQLQKERSLNPLNLLSQISYTAPMLDINEFRESITINGTPPQILINGIRKRYADLNALTPKDILKVEYITYPDARYGVPYINIVTVKPVQGGSVMATVNAPVTSRQENHQAYASYHRGKHSVSANYSGMFSDRRKDYRNATEEYFSPDKEYEFDLKGLPSRQLDRSHTATLEYSLTENPKKMFVATASMDYSSTGQNNRQECLTPSESYRRLTGWTSRSLSPSLQLYGSVPAGDNGRVELSLTGAYRSGKQTRDQSQTDGYSESTLTNSDAYTLGGNIYFQHQFPWSKFTVSLTQNFNKTANDYTIAGTQTDNRMHSSYTSATTALGGQLGSILYYYATAGLKYHRVREGYTSPYAYVSLQKNVRKFNFQYTFSASSYPFGLSSLSDVAIPVNEVLYRSGNMKLKDCEDIQTGVTAYYGHNNFSAYIKAYYRTGKNDLITYCEYVDDPASPIYGKFLQTYENADRTNTLGANLSMGLSNILSHFSVKVNASYSDMGSRWDGHKWEKKSFYLGGSASAYYGRWQFSTNLNLIPDYNLSGNMLKRNFTSWGVYAGWSKGSWTLMCYIEDLFNKKAFYQKSTIMAIGSLTRTSSWLADKNSLISLSVRYQLNFGERAKKYDRTISGDTKVDTGVDLK